MINYKHHIGKYASKQVIDDAVNNGDLLKPYVALDVSSGTIDWNSIEVEPAVETRIKNTYRVTQEDLQIIPGLDSIPVVRYPNGCVIKVETEDGTELPEPEEGASQYELPITGAGEYVVYITISGTSIEGAYGDGLFYYLMFLADSEIPSKVTNIPDYTYYDCSRLSTITFFGTTPPVVGSDTLDWYSMSEINVPVGYEDVYATAFSNSTGMSFMAIGNGKIGMGE